MDEIVLTKNNLTMGFIRIVILITMFAIAMLSGVPLGWSFLAANGFLVFFNAFMKSIAQYKDKHHAIPH